MTSTTLVLRELVVSKSADIISVPGKPPQPEEIQALLLRSAHFIVHALSQNPLFRQEGKAITDELGSVMDALGIHYEDCGCGCKGQ